MSLLGAKARGKGFKLAGVQMGGGSEFVPCAVAARQGVAVVPPS